MDEEHGWGIGTFTVRSHHDGGSNGDYELTYEIRRTPLPDLRVQGRTSSRSIARRNACMRRVLPTR